MIRRDLLTAALALSVTGVVMTTGAAWAENLWETLPFPTSYPAATSEGYADINGIRLYHAQWGAGDPVILLHGGLGSIEAWANQIPEVAKTHKVIAIDSRGHGRSTRDATPYSYTLMASDVLALMDEMGIAKAAVLGWSDGGIIALEIAITHPDRISGALTVGTNYNLDGLDPGIETNAVFGKYVGQAAGLYASISPTPDQFEAFVGDIAGMWGSQPDYSEDQLKSVSAPFTVVQALQDEAIIDEHAAKMAALLPGSSYVPMEGVSHFAMWQDPARMNGEIRKFLDSQ
ncbi:MAG: pimeloyl-ACP methyl ester carboxylesterase [Paracoccaceae bacterium]|jgi:pimeloyl-ACP methyl ester carboxylesterase